MSTGEERADYLLEAYLDEQNTLIRPLVARKLHLVKQLDERAQLVETLLDEKRKNFLSSKRGAAAEDLLGLIESLEDELDQLSIEKVVILQQLMDLVKRPFDTIVEVEETLLASPGGAPAVVSKKNSSANPQPQIVEEQPPDAVVSDELWCFCRKPDDGRPMVACDNPKCELVWWHADCIEKYIAANRIGTAPPEDNRKWHCPVCLAQEVALGGRRRK